MSGSVIAQLITLAVSPILARIYSPEQFGEYSLFMGIVGVIAVAATGRYEIAILLAKNEKDISDLRDLALSLVAASSVVSLIFIYFLNTDKNFNYSIFLIPVLVLFVGINNTYDRICNRQKNYKLMAFQKILGASIVALVSIIVAWKYAGVNGLVLGAIVGSLFSAFYVVSCMRIGILNTKALFDLKALIFTAKNYSNLPKYNLPQAVLNVLSASLPIFIIQFFFDSQILGVYAFAVRMVLNPIGIINSAIYNVVSQNLAEKKSHNESLIPFFVNTAIKIFVVVLIIAPFFYFAANIFEYVFGEQWTKAGGYIEILSPYYLLIVFTAPFAYIPILFERQKKALIIEIVATLLKVASLMFGGLTGNIDTALKFYSISGACVALFTIIWYFNLVKKNKYG